NLFSNYATAGKRGQLGTDTYQESIDRFVREVPVPQLSFDHYPVVAFGSRRPSLRPGWYENLEVVTAAARKVGKPMWALALAAAHGPYPVPPPAHLRMQAYSNLAYGAQGIVHFGYWTPRPVEFDFHDGPVTAQGKRTPVYDHVKALNKEVQ